jgi:aminoglycoside phosphotransferase (APT) family kinase protein
MVRGVDLGPLTAWLTEELDGFAPPYQVDLVSGGHSNLTYRITDRHGRRAALRRPPFGDLPRGAHDVVREHRILTALRDTPVQAPTPLAVCPDPSVTGAPFYAMAWLDGHVVATPDDVERWLARGVARRTAADSLVDALAALHALDPDEVGLGGLGERQDPLGRQLARTRGVWERTRTRDLPVMDRLAARLEATRPAPQRVGLVHADVRLGNAMLNDDGTVAALLDWELCTVGDVLTDVGFLLDSWQQPDDAWPQVWMAPPPTLAGGFPTRTELLDRYAERTGLDLSRIAYYRAFSYWRIAVIAEGMKRRYEARAMATDDIDHDHLAKRVVDLAMLGLDVLESDAS